MTDGTLAALVLHELAELRAELRRLRDVVDRQPARRLPDVDREHLARMLPVLVATLGSELWTVAEVFALAREPRGHSLRTVLGSTTAKQCGRRLLRAQGVDVDGYIVERVGDSGRDGAVWKVLVDLRRLSESR